MSKTNVRALACLFAVVSGGVVLAENTDPANDGSQYAWGENVGWLNAEPSENGGPGVQVDDSKVTGWMWGENIGWVSLSCENTSSCGSVSYGVLHDGFGVLSGYAWGENVGWISFAPPTAGVTFDPATGSFAGYAWGENIGWISFNCSNTGSCAGAAYKVRTGWSCASAPPSGSPALAVGKSGANANLSWPAIAGAGRYDVVRGDLSTLRSTGGDFTAATTACVANDQAGTSASVSGAPAAGNGFWFLVRAVSCGGGGTYNDGSPKQIGDRDPEIALSAGACP